MGVYYSMMYSHYFKIFLVSKAVKMKFTSFLFICGWYLSLILFADAEWLGVEVQLGIAGIFIFLVGIPHGAIDHVIFFEENKSVPMLYFYLFYFGMMGLYILAWLYLPFLSFVFFLLLSAFHFGQSQFSDLQKVSKVFTYALYFLWGSSILSGLIFYRAEELHQLFTQFSDLQSLEWAFSEKIHAIIFPVSTVLSVFILAVLLFQEKINSQRFFLELFLLLLIHLSFFTLPIVIGFTLYFCTLHSMRVLVEEFNYLKLQRPTFYLRHFLQLLFPYSFLSGVGGGLLLLMSYWGWISVSNILLGLILISIVTLPHSFVMDRFYKKRNQI